MYGLISAALLLAAGSPAAPADSVHLSGSTPSVHAALTEGHLHIDGRLEEAEWAGAPVADRFTQRDPNEGQPGSERTEIRVLIGSDALYIGARLYDREPGRIRQRLVRRDEDLASDRFTVYIDSDHDRLTAYRFDVNPAGSYRDAAIDAQGRSDASWDPVWHVETSSDSLGWSAEMEIPLSQLRFRRATNAVWGIQLERWIDRKQELDQFAFVPKSEHADVSRYGELVGLGDLLGRQHFEFLPYATTKYESGENGADDDFSGSIGSDFKYRFGSGLTLDATVHPDFGQVEVDPAVVNLTTTETFFPEKRPFFIERAELFQFGQTSSHNYFGTPIIFHARRIGRAPEGLIDDSIYRPVDIPEQTDIAGAVKLTGKPGANWSIGVLDAVTVEENAHVVDTLGVEREIPVEPLTNYAVARVRRDFNQGGTTLGAIATAVNRDQSNDPLNALLRSQAYVGGLDLNHYFGKRHWSLDANVAASTVHGSQQSITLTQLSSVRYFQRPDAAYLDFDPTRTHLEGFADFLSLNKVGGEHWLGSLTYQEMSPGFENDDLGYAGSVDKRGFSTLVLYKEDKPAKLLRNWDMAVFSNNQLNYGGDMTYQGYEWLWDVTFHNYWSASGRASSYPLAYDGHITRGGPLVATPSGGRVFLSVNTDSRKSYLLGFFVESSWNDAGTHSLQLAPSLTLHPTTSLLIQFSPSFVSNRDMGQYVTTQPDSTATATYGSRYVFATLEQRTLSLDTRVDWTFSPTLSFQLYVQPFVASGEYTSIKELQRPSTSDYAVYGTDKGTITPVSRGYQIDPDGSGPAENFFVLDPNFNFRSLIGSAVLRWEYRPGSTLFLVWQQHRTDQEPIGNFDLSRDLSELFKHPAENVVALKVTYRFWL
jgi:hypothetical protein